jgi:SulP family sulfate permease
MSQNRFVPKFWTCLKEGYTRQQVADDVLAGIIVGIVALPLAIAFAIASGVKPEQGLYTAIVAGFLIALFSGSRVQIGGPTGAFIVIVYGIVQKYGYDGLAIATLMAGVLLIFMGLARLGSVIKYIPYPVTVGFTSGIALIIFTGQIPQALGINLDNIPSEFLGKIAVCARHLGDSSLSSVLLTVATILIILFWPRITRKVPGSLIAILLTTALVQLFDLQVATIGSRFGGIPSTLPLPHLPAMPDWERLRQLSSPALTIAILAGIESLLSAVVADGMTERRHRSNMELIAQGIANLASPLFGGIPATGAIARTATNIKNGGKTPIAGITHAITLLLILLFFGKWAALIPMSTLAGILIIVAWNMSEAHLFVNLLRGPKSDVLVLVATFGLTVLVDLTVAIQVGIVLAAFLFMRRMAETTEVSAISEQFNHDEEEPDQDPDSLRNRVIPEGVQVFEINGPFFFGAADKFKYAISTLERPAPVLILRMRHALSLDATALKAVETVAQSSRKNGTYLLLSGVHEQPLKILRSSGVADKIGHDNIFPHIDAALIRANALLGNDDNYKTQKTVVNA